MSIDISSQLLHSLSQEVGALLLQRGETLAVAESCTGGALGASFVDVAGASGWFNGGVIAYSNSVKESVLGVSAETLVEFGAVSSGTALEMSRGASSLLQTSWGLSTTGIAGPAGAVEGKPVGTVYIGVYSSSKKRGWFNHYCFNGDRMEIRLQTVVAAAAFLKDLLQDK